MLLKDRLRKSKLPAIISTFTLILVLIYGFMVVVKNIHIATSDTNGILHELFYAWTDEIIQTTSVWGGHKLWSMIPVLPSPREIFAFCKLVVPPIIIFIVSVLFIQKYFFLLNERSRCKRKIQKQLNEREFEEDAGLHDVTDKTSIELRVDNMPSEPRWNELWWGQLLLVVAGAAVIFALGLN